MLIFEITEMKTTDYMDTKELGDIIKQYGGSDEVASKVLAALRVFQTKSMEIFYKIEAEQGYSVNGKPLEKSLIRKIVPKRIPDDVVGIWIAKNISPKGTKLKPNWSWREDPKTFTQHPDMIKLREFIQDKIQEALDGGNIPITIQHFDQDDEMAPLFRLNINTNENLRDWFGKGKKGGAGGGGWDRYNTKGERIGKCGDSKKGEGKPKCLSKSRAASLRAKGGKKAIAAAVRKKRRNDPNKNRRGKAKNVSNTTKTSKKKK